MWSRHSRLLRSFRNLTLSSGIFCFYPCLSQLHAPYRSERPAPQPLPRPYRLAVCRVTDEVCGRRSGSFFLVKTDPLSCEVVSFKVMHQDMGEFHSITWKYIEIGMGLTRKKGENLPNDRQGEKGRCQSSRLPLSSERWARPGHHSQPSRAASCSRGGAWLPLVSSSLRLSVKTALLGACQSAVRGQLFSGSSRKRELTAPGDLGPAGCCGPVCSREDAGVHPRYRWSKWSPRSPLACCPHNLEGAPILPLSSHLQIKDSLDLALYSVTYSPKNMDIQPHSSILSIRKSVKLLLNTQPSPKTDSVSYIHTVNRPPSRNVSSLNTEPVHYSVTPASYGVTAVTLTLCSGLGAGPVGGHRSSLQQHYFTESSPFFKDAPGQVKKSRLGEATCCAHITPTGRNRAGIELRLVAHIAVQAHSEHQ